VIVRVLGEDQFRLSDEAFRSVSAADDEVQAAAEAGDEQRFQAALAELIREIRAVGSPLPVDEFVGSDAVVPGEGTPLEEARALLSDEGLIPN
jgi:hypothetical protein